jgi:Flp pilus assembly protein TadD
MIDCRLYGPRPWGHHLSNVLLHALNTLLLFLVFRNMTGAVWRSLIVAALFGLHPLRVESVAWVAERKDVLSGLFFMLTLLAYSRHVQHTKAQGRRTGLSYTSAMVTFAFGLMSKPMLVTVPFVLLLLDWWPLNRIPGPNTHGSSSAEDPTSAESRKSILVRLVCEKVPFFLLAAASCVATFKAQQGGDAVFEALPWNARLEHALVSYCRYIGKLFWPVDLSVYYPHVGSWPIITVLACGMALALISSFAVLLSRRRPWLPVAWFWYLGMLVPVIGVIQAGSQSMADRYTYLPAIGLLIVIVWGTHELAGRSRTRKAAFCAAAAVAAVACMALTQREIRWWKDSETLFRHAIAVTGRNTVALNNLGRALAEKGVFDEATIQYREALKLDSNNAFACNGLGVLSMKKREFDAAAEYFEKAIAVDPKNAIAHYNLGIIMASRGLLDEAISQFDATIQINPDFAEAYNNLGGALTMQGRFDGAIPCYREAIRLKPGNAMAHKNLGAALVEQGKFDEAIHEFQEAVKLQPDFTEARERFREALELKGNGRVQAKPE